MSRTVLTVKRGDVGVLFNDTLTADGEVVDLTGCTVTFLLRDTRTDTLTTGVATVISAAEGLVRYVSAANDLDPRGTYEQEWEVAFGTGEIYTFPSVGYNIIKVVKDLNPP